MENYNEIKNKNDVIVKASDFVIEHDQSDVQNTFKKHYTLDNFILGEGAFGRV